MAADFKTAQPLEYYRHFLKEEIRPDGRSILQFRQTTLNVGSISTAEGSALVKLGNTTVICGIKAEFAEPIPASPKNGFIGNIVTCGVYKYCWTSCSTVPNVDLPPLCSPRFRPGPPGEQAQVLSQFINDIISNCKLIDLESLCIVEGKLVWVLYIDMMCLDYDGNLTDACLTAMMAALYNTKLYTVTVNEETQTPETSESRDLELSITTHPVAATFGIFDDTVIFGDPTDEEESLASGVVTVVTTSDDKLAAVHKPGGSALSEDKLQECFRRAVTRGREIRELVKTVCESDGQKGGDTSPAQVAR